MDASTNTEINTNSNPSEENDTEMYSYYNTIGKSIIILLCNHILEIINILCFVLSTILILICVCLLTISLYINEIIKNNYKKYNLPNLKDIIDIIININAKQISNYINVFYLLNSKFIDHSIDSENEGNTDQDETDDNIPVCTDDEEETEEDNNEDTSLDAIETDETNDTSVETPDTSVETHDNPDESRDHEELEEFENSEDSE